MLDHVFIDAIGALKDSLEDARLERLPTEERYKTDILLGDQTFETSYALPGEHHPAAMQADVILEWPTWSQTAYRSWYIGETPTETPRIEVQIGVTAQFLVSAPDPSLVLDFAPVTSPPVGTIELDRSGPTVTYTYENDQRTSHAIVVAYEGSYDLNDDVLADANLLDRHFTDIGFWTTSLLVKVGDLKLEHLPDDQRP